MTEGGIESDLGSAKLQNLDAGDAIMQQGATSMQNQVCSNGGLARVPDLTNDFESTAASEKNSDNVLLKTSSNPVKIIYGTESFSHIGNDEASRILRVARDFGITEVDTANLYANSEKMIGLLQGGRDFTIHTKAPGVLPGSMKKNKILAGLEKSLQELGVSRVQTYFLHSTDPETPIEETMEAIQELYLAGKFVELGVSNFPPAQLQELHDLAISRSYVLPTVYEGNYNPVARHAEKTLWPLLRKLNMRFFAYSPLAGGFLAKDVKEFEGDMTGRWDKNSFVGSMYRRLYARPKLLQGLTDWEVIAKAAGTSKAELAVRWMLHHSFLEAEAGDAIIVGARRSEQLEEILRWSMRGPLSQMILKQIEAVWTLVESEAPIDNMQG